MARPLRIGRLSTLGALALGGLLAACGGGGSSSAPSPRSSSAPVSPTGGNASLTMVIPSSGSAAARARHIQTISANTASVVVTLVKTDNVTVSVPQALPPFNVSATSPLCTADASGNRTCTIAFAAPLGNDVYTVDLYDASGNRLGSGAATLDVIENQSNTATVAIGGTIAGVLLVAPTAQLSLGIAGNAGGSPQTERIYAIGFDGSGNPIIIPDTYTSPITLTVAGTNVAQYLTASVVYAFPGNGPASAATSATVASIPITSPGDTITLNVNPNAVGSAAFTLTASVGTATPAPGATGVGPISQLTGSVTGATPAPTPTPTPIPPTPTPSPSPALTWTSTSTIFTPATTTTAASIDFPGYTTPGQQAALTLLEATTYSGTITLQQGTPSCAGSISVAAAGSPIALPATVSYPAPGLPITLTGPTLPAGGGVSCQITATDGGGRTAPLSIYVNALSGTVN